MLKEALTSVLIVSVAWGIWPIVGRFSGLPPVWVTVIGSTAGTVTVLVLSVSLQQLHTIPDMKSILWGSLAGFLLGLGLYEYSRLISNPDWEVSTLVPIAAGSITAITAVLGIFIFGESHDIAKLAGLACVIIGIILLS